MRRRPAVPKGGRTVRTAIRSLQGEGKPMRKAAVATAAYRWAIASRVAAAALGGYALTSVATVVLALLWPAPKAQALLWASMLSFVVYAVAVIWVFATRSATRAWGGLLGATALLAALAWLLKTGGGA